MPDQWRSAYKALTSARFVASPIGPPVGQWMLTRAEPGNTMPVSAGRPSSASAEGGTQMPEQFCINCGRRMTAAEISDENTGGYCYDCAEDEGGYEEEPPDWLRERLTNDERSWIRDRARNTPPAGFVVGALFVVAWLWLLLGLAGSIGLGVETANSCEETVFRQCDDATTEGFLVFGIGAVSTLLGTLMLWGFAHLLDLNLESRERHEDLYFERVSQKEASSRPRRRVKLRRR